MDFTNDQIERYSRHILLKDIGGIGQKKLLESRVLIIGAGGLGSPIATYLAAAGVGTIGIVDADVVDLSNLQRQILHHTADVGVKKVESAKATIESLNPDVKVELHPYRLDASNIREVIREYDFILEGTDNFPTKFLVNDACILEGKAFNQGGILRFKGQTMTHIPGSASYRCVYRQPPPAGAVPTCSEAGVLGAIAGILGTIQAAEALKYLTGAGELLTDRILMFDALTMEFRTVSVKKTPWALPVSQGGNSPETLVEYEQEACDLETVRTRRREAGLAS
jgi:molybdopterin/thiamine biosynthesis adenylyltransferase